MVCDYHIIITGSSSDNSKVLMETIAFMQLFQPNFIVNYKDNIILDLVIFNNNSLEVTKCSLPLVSIDMVYPPLQIIILGTVTFR